MSASALLRNYSRVFAWFIAGCIFFLVNVTSSHYGVAWDEPAYFHASNLHIDWLSQLGKNLLNGEISKSLKDDIITAAWHWDPYHVPHPPFSRIISGLANDLFYPAVDKFVAYRLGPALFFAGLVGVMYLWMAEIFDSVTGLFSALGLVLIPNLFGFAHLAVTDMPLAAMWFFTTYCFWRGLKDWKWSIAVGIVWGFALSTKFPAFLIPIPLLIWAHLYYRRSYANNLFCMIFLGPIVMIATQPYLWHQTSLRILEFLYEGLSRGYRPEANFPVFFFNQVYLTSDLPRYYPFFLAAVTTPETILFLSLIGIFGLAQAGPGRDVMMLFLFHVLFVLSLALLPGAVLHDGMRQLLSALPFIVGLSAAGFYRLAIILAERVQQVQSLQTVRNLKAKLVAALFVLLLFPPALDLIAYHPFELSYYNRFVGGIRGAYRSGLEASYFMEAITPQFLTYLNRELPLNASVNGLFSNFMLSYYQEEGKLRRDIKITEEANSDYAVILNRRSVLRTLPRNSWAFLKTAEVAASVSLAEVPLVVLYRKLK